MTTAPALRGDIPDWELCDGLQLSMRKAGLGSGEMARRLGVDPTTVSRWLSGKKQPGRPALIAWAALTGVDLDWLETLRACRDSNPKPSDLERAARRRHLRLVHSVKRTLTAERLGA